MPIERMNMKSTKLIAALIVLTIVATPVLSYARAGGRSGGSSGGSSSGSSGMTYGSQGSRGSKTFDNNGAKPIERTMTPQTTPGSAPPSTASPAPAPAVPKGDLAPTLVPMPQTKPAPATGGPIRY